MCLEDRIVMTLFSFRKMEQRQFILNPVLAHRTTSRSNWPKPRPSNLEMEGC